MPQRASRHLFGRKRELDVLIRALADCERGMARVVWIGGEPGIGKTRLAEELAAAAAAERATVAWARCVDAETAPPYWPWAEGIRALLQTVAPEELHLPVSCVERISALVPELIPRPAAPTRSAALATASGRYQLFDAVRTLLQRASSRAVVVLVLDDLHQADPSSLLLLEFVARELSSKAKVPKGLAEAVEGAGGDVLKYAAPRARDLPARLSEDAGRRGFRLDQAVARLLVDRMGEGTLRLANELDRLALWAGADGEVTLDDLEAMVADTSQEAVWALSDAIVARDPSAALGAAERLLAQGEAVTPLVYQAARRLRDANAAVAQLEEGTPAKSVEASLPMHPYAARMLIRRPATSAWSKPSGPSTGVSRMAPHSSVFGA